jgi:hypothetical protein
MSVSGFESVSNFGFPDSRGTRAVAIALLALGLIGCRGRDDVSASGRLADAAASVASAEPSGADESSSADGAPLADESPVCSVGTDRPAVASMADESPTVAAPVRTLPTRRPRNKDELVTITFDDLKVNMKEDQLFEPWMATDRVRELDGQRVRIRGFLFPAIFQQKGIDKFPLVMDMECKFGPGGLAHHVILVEMVDGATTSYTIRPIAVTGRLTLAPWNGPDGNTWALYHIAGERVN